MKFLRYLDAERTLVMEFSAAVFHFLHSLGIECNCKYTDILISNVNVFLYIINERSHNYVYKQTIGVKYPSKSLASGSFYLDCCCLCLITAITFICYLCSHYVNMKDEYHYTTTCSVMLDITRICI